MTPASDQTTAASAPSPSPVEPVVYGPVRDGREELAPLDLPEPATTTAPLTTIERLRDAPPRDGALGWAVTLAITLFAFVLRLINIGEPGRLVFDETYYPKDAWGLLHHGFEYDMVDKANDMIAAGQLDGLFKTTDCARSNAIDGVCSAYVVHPPLGKWLIAGGEHLFGMNSFGWRFSALVFGSLMILFVIRLARRLSRSLLVGAIAGILLTFDGLQFVMSRIGLLDIFQATFLVAGFAAVAADRDWFRNRLADHLERHGMADLDGAFGPRLWWRPWRLAAGLMIGLSVAVKWNSIYALAGIGLLSVVWDLLARRSAGARFAPLRLTPLSALALAGGLSLLGHGFSWLILAATAGIGVVIVVVQLVRGRQDLSHLVPGIVFTAVPLLALAATVLTQPQTASGGVYVAPHYSGGALWRSLQVFAHWHVFDLLGAVALLTVGWWLVTRRPDVEGADREHQLGWSVAGDGLWAFVWLVVVSVPVYLATWIGWFATRGGWDRQWVANGHNQESILSNFPNWLGSWFAYEREVYQFHTGDFINSVTHTYNANPAGWLLNLRPIGIAATNDIKPGTNGCTATGSDTCVQVISGLGTPVLWWLAAAALVASLVYLLWARDWRFALPVIGTLTMWLPWFQYTSRPLFFFYAINVIPFTTIGLAMCLGIVLGQPGTRQRRWGGWVVSAAVGLVALNFAFFYPIYTNQMMTRTEWLRRMWFGSWI